MKDHKNYLILVNYGTYEGWRIFTEVDEWEQAVKELQPALSIGNHEVIIVEYCPLVVLRGRKR